MRLPFRLTMPAKHLIVLVGPTAIGKTHWAIQIAKHFNSEILSADSRQFYREMRIGTAVPSRSELQAVPHHFIQHKSMHDTYSVGDWVHDATNLLNDLFEKHDVLVVTGGSGLYINALLYGLDEFPEIDPQIREDLNKQLIEEGLAALQAQLQKVDPEYFEKVDLDNPHRVIRALEVSIGSGQPYSSFLGKKKVTHHFNPILIGLRTDREILYNRINSRVDAMIDQGLVEEARELYTYRNLNALQTVGYQELFSYFERELSLEEAIEAIKMNTRRYAKRQLTWLRKMEEVSWFSMDNPKELLLAYIEDRIKQGMSASKKPIVVIMGVSGSGKSTLGRVLAQQLHVPFIEGDDYHPVSNVEKMRAGTPLNDQDRYAWLKALNEVALEHVSKGAVMACSALKETYRKQLSHKMADNFIWILLDGTYEIIQNRMKERKDHFMPPALLRSQFDTLEKPDYALWLDIEEVTDIQCEKALEWIQKKHPDRGA